MSSKKTYAVTMLERRTALRFAVAGSMGLMLVACGGGGGDSSSDKVGALREAYAKLHDGMVWTDVEALVGFPANNWRTDTNLKWVVDGVSLYVTFFSTDEKTINGATLKEADGVTSQHQNYH
ncbi:hypothetical protein [Hydrogenophaga sp.]|uniref:hypothetical protein n=1 Tax=Hydrogenophaga sp. TaxID=1904254 RepID=UPI0035B4228D